MRPTTHNSQTQILADQITYRPFGALQQATLGNGLSLNYHYDMDARLQQQTTVGIHEQTYAYDLNSNIEQIIRSLNIAENQTLDYDALDRLIQADSPAVNHSYAYDPTGNRLSKTGNGQTETYTYIQNTHHLEAISGAQNINYQYDAAGNPIQRNNDTYIYNSAGRLARIETASQTIEYLYNAQGQRTLKYITEIGVQPHTETVTVYIYNLEGLLIAELNNTGQTQVEYAYLNGQPLSQISAANAEVYYYHNDHLGTPQKLTSQNQAIVWEATYTPFGQATVNEDPDNDGNTVTQNIRFPGQYFDQETGFHYNYFRYYDPLIGRYITGDPIGVTHDFSNPQLNSAIKLASEGFIGLGKLPNHLYNYVDNNPAKYTDPIGLLKISFGGTGTFFAGGAGGNTSVFFGFDTSLQFCVQVRTCALGGAGVETGVGKSLRVGSGEFCEGDAVEGGFFAEGGFGPFGGMSFTAGGDGFNLTTTVGGGGGAAVGAQICIIKTKCFQ